MPDQPHREVPTSNLAWRLIAPAIAAGAGLLVVLTGKISDSTDLRPGRSERLADLIVSTEHENARAQQELTALRAEVSTLSAAQAGDEAVIRARRQVAALSGHVGLAAISGPGVTVSLTDAPAGAIDEQQPGWPEPGPDDLVVHQQDVQAVVNALWAGGATDMAIMDQRVISTSAIRCVGNTLILHGRVYSPPYRISALGVPDELVASLDGSKGVGVFRQYATAYGLGYAVTRRADITLPGYTGPVELEHARVAIG